MHGRNVQTTLFATLLLCLSGCSSLQYWWNNDCRLGPNHGRPLVPVASDWIGSEDESVIVHQQQMADWWQVFNDPNLDQLIATAYQQNLSLRTAGLRVLEARAQRNITAANLFPQSQGGFGQFSRNRLSGNSANARPGGAFSFDDWQTGFDLSWEIDVWGRLRRAIEASDAAVDAEVESYDDVLVTLVGDVAASYIELRSLDERLELAETNVTYQEGSLKLAQIEFNAENVAELDVVQAKANVADTKSSIPALRLQRRQAVNTLAILLGMTPYDLEPLLRDRGRIPDAPNEVVVGIPANLIRRRPDIRATERKIAQQCAQIGIAEAELYPQFAINGEIKLNSDNLSNLFASQAIAGTISPGFRWKILNYGRLRSNIEVQQIRFQQTIVQYENAVLAAHREVEDAMVVFLESKKQVTELRKSVEAVKRSAELVRIQYEEGETDFNRVFTIEATLVQAQDRLVAAEANVAIGLTRVYKALGGGWQIRMGTPYTGIYSPQIVSWPPQLPPVAEPDEEDAAIDRRVELNPIAAQGDPAAIEINLLSETDAGRKP